MLRSRRAEFIKASDSTFASTGRIYGSNLVLVSNEPVSCKTGWVHICIDHDSGTESDVLQQADSARHLAKEFGRNHVYVYNSASSEVEQRRTEMELVASIHRALEEGRFFLYAQPIVSVASGGEHAAHYEVLLRMQDKQGNIISPGDFFGSAERYGLAGKIDRWVIQSVIDCLQSDPAHVERLSLCSINLSGYSISDIGKEMRLETIAEFVEDEDILAILADIGVHHAQGYGVARPLPMTELLSQ